MIFYSDYKKTRKIKFNSNTEFYSFLVSSIEFRHITKPELKQFTSKIFNNRLNEVKKSEVFQVPYSYCLVLAYTLGKRCHLCDGIERHYSSESSKGCGPKNIVKFLFGSLWQLKGINFFATSYGAKEISALSPFCVRCDSKLKLRASCGRAPGYTKSEKERIEYYNMAYLKYLEAITTCRMLGQ